MCPAGAFYKQHPDSGSSSEGSQSDIASAIVETGITAMAGTVNTLDVMVFWYSIFYRYKNYRKAIKGVAAEVRGAIEECPQNVPENQGSQETLLAFAICIQGEVQNSLPAMLITTDEELGFYSLVGGLIKESAKVRGYHWKVIALAFFP